MDEFGAPNIARRWVIVVLLGTVAAGAFYGFVVRAGCIDTVTVTQTGGRYHVDIWFTRDVRYRGHFPPERGRVLQIQIEPHWLYRYVPDRYFELGDLDLRVRGGSPVSLLAYEGAVPGGPLISIRFTQAMRFQIKTTQKEGLLQLTLEPEA